MFENISFAQVVYGGVILLIARWIVRGIYRVYFHPLRKFPGPKFSAFTRIPYLRAQIAGRHPEYVSRIHDRYGDVARISPDELSFIGPQAWRDIYGHGAKEGQGLAPPKNFSRYPKTLNGAESLLVKQDDAEHARSRKIFTPAFSDRALAAQSPLFLRYADQLVTLLKKHAQQDSKLNLVRYLNFTTFDVMGDLTFGESLHMLDKAEYDPWVQAMFASIKTGARMSLIYSYYPVLARIVKAALHKSILKKQTEHYAHAATRVTKRLEKGRASEGVDLWDLILQQQDKGKAGLPRDEMDANAAFFMIAGTETTATLLSGLTYLLLKHPESMNKLVDEVRGAFESSDAISMEAVAALPYLNACIKEGLRHYPPVPMGFPHLTPREGSTICGHYVPPGVTVAGNHLPMYMSPTLFKDPHSFIPERWTGDERFANDERSAVQPFSVGPRDCLGKNMAYHEMRLILSKIVYNFEFELCPESEGWLNQGAFTLWEKPSLMVKIKTASSA